MTRMTDKEKVDSLINHFWKNGFLTVSRKHGNYLPDPSPVGDYEVDAVGKLNKKYVLGLNLTSEDLLNPNLISKIEFLASQKSKFSLQKVTLFLGCPDDLRPEVESLLLKIDEPLRKNIKIVSTSFKNDI